MHDLALAGFLAAFLALGLRRPFLFVLAYVYVDIVSPQRLSYYLLNAVPVSLICVVLAVLGWAVADDKTGTRIAPRQILILLLLLWAGWTTLNADFPVEALDKWSWVWKALAFAIFLPLTLRTRLRIEALLLVMILSAASIVIVGGIKTLFSGGGYGALNLMVDNNSGLYEGSIISTVAIAIIPIILFLARFGTIYPPDWRVRLFAGALAFACLLIPIGTQARTGLICIGLLALLGIRVARRRLLCLALLAGGVALAMPLLPAGYTQRMDTIAGYRADSSASTRLAVWRWTWAYAKAHPLGGGFEAYRQNHIRFETVATEGDATNQSVQATAESDRARAYHSSYFEMLGEQGFPGLAMWLLLNIGGVVRMEIVRRRYRGAGEERDRWIAPLATALQAANLIYMAGSLFVGIAFQPFIYMLIGCQIGFDTYLARRRRGERFVPIGGGARGQAGWAARARRAGA